MCMVQVGMVFQNGALFDSLTVGENVGFLLYEHTSLPHERIQVTLVPKPQDLFMGALSTMSGLICSNVSYRICIF